ncbi:hypothetical protein SLA2020_184020 [Shorea laevis]
MIKALKKKLNFWSRKKRKRKSLEPSFNYDYHPIPILPPYCSHYQYCCSSSTLPQPQPSAPPLPSWLEAEEHTTQEAISALEVQPFVEPSYSNQPDEQIVSETTPIYSAFSSNVSSTTHSYQLQYTVSNPPVYGVPVAVLEETTKRERFFGRVVELVGCFCPCLRIRDEALPKTSSRITSYNC